MASKLHWGNYLPNQIPIFLQTHFHLLYWNLPKNSVPTPFRITVSFLLQHLSQQHSLFQCWRSLNSPVQICCAHTHKQGNTTGVGPHRKGCRPKTHMGHVLGVLNLEQLYWDPTVPHQQDHSFQFSFIQKQLSFLDPSSFHKSNQVQSVRTFSGLISKVPSLSKLKQLNH